VPGSVTCAAKILPSKAGAECFSLGWPAPWSLRKRDSALQRPARTSEEEGKWALGRRPPQAEGSLLERVDLWPPGRTKTGRDCYSAAQLGHSLTVFAGLLASRT